MKNFTQFFKCTFALAAILLIGGGKVCAEGWTWTGETPASGSSYYLYTQNQSKFLNDDNGFDTNPTILWTIGGSFSDNYTLTSNNSKQFAMYRTGSWPSYKYYVVTNATGKNGSDINLSSGINNGLYSIYRQSKDNNWSGNRNVGTTANGLSIVKDASNEWRFISTDEKSVYDKRTISFSATATAKGEGTATASVDNQSVELSNYADRDNKHSTTATFTATPNPGKVFVGWSTDEGGSNIISHNKEYQATITNNWNEGQNSTLTLYANFGDKFEPSITAEKYDLKVEEQTALTFTHTEILAAPVIGNTSVISYSDGVVTALAEGTSTLTFTQEETSTIKAKVIVLTFNVTKHDVVWSWNAENVAYIYNTTIDNIFTLSAGNLANITISTSTNENVAKLVNGNLVIGKVAGTAQFTVTAVADNKWNAKEETFTVTPGHVANHVPYVPTEDLFNNSIIKSIQNISFDNNQQITLGVTGSFNYGDKHIIIPISGIPDKLHIVFDAGWACTGDDWYVYESETNDFSGKSSLVSGIGNDNKSRDITLNHNTRYIKIGNGKNGDSYIKNLSISEYKTLSAETPQAIMTKLGDTESASANVVLTYANAGLTINASVAGEGFSINKTSVEGGIDVYGEETFVVSFDPTGKAAGEHSATVTFTDGDMRKEVVVTAHVLVPLSLVAMNNEDGTDYYYATFSNADYAVEFGNDVEVYTVSVDGDRMNLNPVSSHQVPANAGVLIKSQSNNILYKYISSAADLSDNMLKPGENGLTAGENCRFYRLAYYDYDAKTGLGFYYGPNCNDGQPFNCKAGLAYLAVPKTTAEAPARFLLDRQDISTDLLNVNVNDNQGKKVMMNGVLYIIRDGKTYDSFGRMVK